MVQRWGRLPGILAFAYLGGMQGLAWAQQADPPLQGAAAASSNVTSYKPDFFAQFRPNTAMDMVGRLPGFSFDGGSDARGFSGTGGNVLIDGERPPSRGDYLGSIIARIPASGVERIDIIRGGADGIDMQGKPIVANIIRKADGGVTGSVSANLNVNEAGNISPNGSLQLRNQSGEQLLDGSLTLIHNKSSGKSRGQRVDPNDVTIRQSESSSINQFDRVEATGAWETTWLGGKLRVNGLAAAEQFEFTSVDQLIIPGGQQLSSGGSENASGEAGIRYSRNFEGGYALELVGFQSIWSGRRDDVFNTPSFTSGSGSDDETGESIVRGNLRLPGAGEWTLEGGGEVVYNYSDSAGARSFDGAPFVLDGDESHVDELRLDYFSTATWAPIANLNLELGLRYEWSRITADVGSTHSQKELNFWKPRVNLSWTPEAGHQIGVRLERTVDQLDFGSFASSAAFEQQVFGIGNVDAEPEKNWTFDARYERQFGGQNSLVVSFEHIDTEDVLGRAVIVVPATSTDPEQEFEITRNSGRATRDSLNLKGSFELDSFGLSGGIFSFGGSLRDSKVTDPVTGEEHAISNDEPWSWNVSLQQTLGNGDFRWGVFLEDDDDVQSWTPRQYTTRHGGTFLGANFSWKPIAGWTFGAGANNLLAEDPQSQSIFYTARRGVGVPQYFATGSSTSRRQFFVTLRKNF